MSPYLLAINDGLKPHDGEWKCCECGAINLRDEKCNCEEIERRIRLLQLLARFHNATSVQSCLD